jgi:hypothetical protein
MTLEWILSTVHLLYGMEVGRTGRGSCPVLSFGISGVETLDCVVRDLQMSATSLADVTAYRIRVCVCKLR